MGSLTGFWSYSRADDNSESGRIITLARDVANEYELLTGDSIDLFLDRDSLEWGASWRQRIDSSLQNVAFFVPVLTPRFFQSHECRREFGDFAEVAQKTNLTRLILPILYVDLSFRVDTGTDDELLELARSLQWVDLTEVRLEGRLASRYRQKVAEMAARLADANRALVEETRISGPGTPVTIAGSENDFDAPGFMDLIAGTEDALPEWQKIVERMTELIGELGTLMTESQAAMSRSDANNKGMAGRLFVARKLAADLLVPATEFSNLGRDYVVKLREIDLGTRAAVELALSDSPGDPEGRHSICGFFNAIRRLSEITAESLNASDEMLEGFGSIERMSRDLRKPLGLYREGLTRMLEAQEITDDWDRLVTDAASTLGIDLDDCEETSTDL